MPSSVRPFRLVAPVFLLISSWAGFRAWAQSLYIPAGSIAVGVGDGQYDFVARDGVTLYSLRNGSPITAVEPTGKGFTTGCAFSKDLTRLYTTNYGHHSVSIFDVSKPGIELLDTIDTSAGGLQNESVVFDESGNWYVGHAAGSCEVSKYSPDNTLLDTFKPASPCTVNDVGNGTGVNWIELASDQKTLYYTSGEFAVKRYDLSTRTQLPDLITTLKGHAQQIRLLPPFDVNSDLLVADENAIVRIDKNGQIVQRYGTRQPNESVRNWIGLALDPDNRSFWAADTNLGFVEAFNLANGAAETVEPQKTSPLKITGDRVAGMCIQDSPTAPTDPWQTGDIFIGTYYGYARYSSAGVYKDLSVIETPPGYRGGQYRCALNKNGSELIGVLGYGGIAGSGAVAVDGTGTVHGPLFGVAEPYIANDSDAIVFDNSGGFIVGDDYSETPDDDMGIVAGIGVYGPPSGPVDYPSSFSYLFPPLDYLDEGFEGYYGGVYGLSLAADQKTIFYTAGGSHVLLDNLATGNTSAFTEIAGQNLQEVRLLPPFDGTGGLLVDGYYTVYRVDGTGKVIHTYAIPEPFSLSDLHLDPDGTSFWVGGYGSGFTIRYLMTRINIDSGAVEIGPIDTTKFGIGPSCIKGEPGGYMLP